AAEVALAILPIAVGIHPPALDRFLGRLVEVLAAAEIALRMLEYAALALEARHVVANARHDSLSNERVCEVGRSGQDETLDPLLVRLGDEGALPQMPLP